MVRGECRTLTVTVTQEQAWAVLGLPMRWHAEAVENLRVGQVAALGTLAQKASATLYAAEGGASHHAAEGR